MKGLDDFISKPMIFQKHGAKEKHSLATPILPLATPILPACAREKRGGDGRLADENLFGRVHQNEKGVGSFFFNLTFIDLNV